MPNLYTLKLHVLNSETRLTVPLKNVYPFYCVRFIMPIHVHQHKTQSKSILYKLTCRFYHMYFLFCHQCTSCWNSFCNKVFNNIHSLLFYKTVKNDIIPLSCPTRMGVLPEKHTPLVWGLSTFAKMSSQIPTLSRGGGGSGFQLIGALELELSLIETFDFFTAWVSTHFVLSFKDL